MPTFVHYMHNLQCPSDIIVRVCISNFFLFLLQFLSGTKSLRDSKSISPEEKVQLCRLMYNLSVDTIKYSVMMCL